LATRRVTQYSACPILFQFSVPHPGGPQVGAGANAEKNHHQQSLEVEQRRHRLDPSWDPPVMSHGFGRSQYVVSY